VAGGRAVVAPVRRRARRRRTGSQPLAGAAPGGDPVRNTALPAGRPSGVAEDQDGSGSCPSRAGRVRGSSRTTGAGIRTSALAVGAAHSDTNEAIRSPVKGFSSQGRVRTAGVKPKTIRTRARLLRGSRPPSPAPRANGSTLYGTVARKKKQEHARRSEGAPPRCSPRCRSVDRTDQALQRPDFSGLRPTWPKR